MDFLYSQLIKSEEYIPLSQIRTTKASRPIMLNAFSKEVQKLMANDRDKLDQEYVSTVESHRLER